MSFMTAIVVGGAFFGDNLSFISDTTIAATRTQGCAMRDKFRANLMIVLPAAVIVLVYYIVKGLNMYTIPETSDIELIKVYHILWFW
jgi:Na+/H+ antiporter